LLNVVVQTLTSRLERTLTSISKIKLYINSVKICKITATHPAHLAPYSKTIKMTAVHLRRKTLKRNDHQHTALVCRHINKLQWIVDTSTDYTEL